MNKLKKFIASIGTFFMMLVTKVYASSTNYKMPTPKYGVPDPMRNMKQAYIHVNAILNVVLFLIGLCLILKRKVSKTTKIAIFSIITEIVLLTHFISYFNIVDYDSSIENFIIPFIPIVFFTGVCLIYSEKISKVMKTIIFCAAAGIALMFQNTMETENAFIESIIPIAFFIIPIDLLVCMLLYVALSKKYSKKEKTQIWIGVILLAVVMWATVTMVVTKTLTIVGSIIAPIILFFIGLHANCNKEYSKKDKMQIWIGLIALLVIIELVIQIIANGSLVIV